MFQTYLQNIADVTSRGNAREESYYEHLSALLKAFGKSLKKKTDVTTLPKKTDAGNPDFLWLYIEVMQRT